MNNKEIRKALFPRFKDFLTVFFLFVGFTILVVFPAVFKMSGLHFEHMQLKIPESMIKYALTVGYVVPMILTVLFTLYIYRLRPKLTFKPVRPEILPLVLAAMFFLIIFLESLMQWMPSPGHKFSFLWDMVHRNFWLMFSVLAVAAPLLEETLFRGIFLTFLLKKYRPRTAIIISALVFAVFHMNIWQGTAAFVMGLFFGYLFWRTRSLFYPVLLHFMNNALSTIAYYFSSDPDAGLVGPAKESDKWFMLLYGIMAFILFVYLWKKIDEKLRNSGSILYLASNNPHKFEEIERILPSTITLKKLSDLDRNISLRETGKTLKDNSLQKALQVARRYGVDVLSDDTGLEVDALGGRPGVYSARFAGDRATDAENRKKLLEEIARKSDRSARFRTVLTLFSGNKIRQFEGTVEGEITQEPQGTSGFGYDSVFRPEGYEKTFAEMDPAEKNRISHRARAIEKLLTFLGKEFSGDVT